TEHGSELLKNNKLISRIFVISNKIISELKDNNYDLIINLDEDADACSIASALGKEIIGFYMEDGIVAYTPSAKEWFEMGALGKKPDNDILKKKNRKTYQQIMFEILQINDDSSKHPPLLNLTPDEIRFGEDFKKRNNLKKLVVGINTGAGKRWGMKKLSEEKTALLIDMINNNIDCSVILFGGSEEEERNKLIMKLIKTPVTDSGCRNTIRQFASLINLCNIIVTSDTLAMHLAIALKKKAVVIFGPTSFAEIELFGRGRKIIPKMECVCCYKKQCDKKPSCMDNVSVKEIFEAIKGMMDEE
ncbi:glycosyltransferase family 9 protein, partial [Candidatus Woesearchaeota archaeon]|nr:glycosyltransferase family 9 protein [Candidatus Woesearchaeota archaeon]